MPSGDEGHYDQLPLFRREKKVVDKSMHRFFFSETYVSPPHFNRVLLSTPRYIQ